MNLFERIAKEVRNEEYIINNIIFEYFTGNLTTIVLRKIDFDTQVLKIKYRIDINGTENDIDVEVDYLLAKDVFVISKAKIFDRTVTGYLEQTIKRELNIKK